MLDETLGTFDDSEDEKEQLPWKRPRIIGLKKALAWEREKETELAEHLTPSEFLAMEISYERESWLERANVHLEGQLENSKRDIDLQKKMARHYAMRIRIARAKLKRALINVQEQNEAKDKEKLDILADVSLQASQT